MEGWSLFATSFLVGLSGAVMPGPLVTVAIANVGRLGGISGLAASAGHGIPEVLLVAALALGFGDILRIPLVAGLIAIIGGLILAWMAAGMFRSAGAIGIAPVTVASAGTAAGGTTGPGTGAIEKQSNPVRGRTSTFCAMRTSRAALPTIAAGVVASVSNPYWILWWTTIGASYISQALNSGWMGLGLFFGGHILSDILWLTLVSCVIAAGGSFLSRGFYTRLIQVLAGLLFLMAIFFLFTGFKTL